MPSDTHEPADPTVSARGPAATLPKRFYSRVELKPQDGRVALLLDGRSARTPARNILSFPPGPFAEMVVTEWSAQKDVINPSSMPATRLANTALDGVAGQMEAVRDSVRAYVASDLLYYRAGDPAGLVARQNELWNPVIAWAEQTYGCRFILAEGVVFVTQPPATLDAIGKAIGEFDEPFRLTGLQMATTLTGSALIALALAASHLRPEDAWGAGHVDEDWNISQWGEDEEAQARRWRRHTDFQAAALALMQV